MKATAVEWLQAEIDNKDMGEIPLWIYEFIEQAKEMEKEQSHAEYMRGWKDGLTKQETYESNNRI